jgi:nucleoid-associated protein YgaU
LRVAAAACVAVLWIAGNGCGKPVLRVADASLGDYYSEKEFKKLSQEQRDDYCGELAEQRELYREQIDDAKQALAASQLKAGSGKAEAESLRTLAASLEERLAAERERKGTTPKGGTGARAPAGAASSSAGSYVVKKGDSLWRISGRADALGRPAEWRRIYEANRDRISNPDRIYPGQEIEIPR